MRKLDEVNTRNLRVSYFSWFGTLGVMSDKVEVPEVKNARPYDVAPPAQFTEFKRTTQRMINLL